MEKLDGAFGMNPCQLVDGAFKVFNRKQQQKKEDAKGNGTFLVSPHWGRNNVLTVRRKNLATQVALG